MSFLADDLKSRIDLDGFSSFDLQQKKIISIQNGVLRTNCLDCLDRTNVVQTLFARIHLGNLISTMAKDMSRAEKEAMIQPFNNLWADVFFKLILIEWRLVIQNTLWNRSFKI